MADAISHAKETESGFLAGVTDTLRKAGGQVVGGTQFKREDRDQAEKIRGVMADRRVYDRDKFSSLPHNRSVTIRGYERRWFFWNRVRSVTIAGVLAPTADLLDSPGDAPPVTRAQLVDYVGGLITDVGAPHLVGICAPAGFEKDVWDNPPEMGNVKLVLVEPRSDGGWRVEAGDPNLDRRLIKLFDPEDVMAKLGRVKREIKARSVDLVTGSLSAESMAKDLGLPVPLVSNAFEQVAAETPELHVSKKSGVATLFRGVPSASYEEDKSMSITDWIRSLFSKEGDETNKINVLAERRAALSSQRDRMYDDIAELEKKEAKLVEDGKASSSKVTRIRLAGQIESIRKDISRFNTTASMLSKQINIISTHIHNLELSQTGSLAQLPSSDELAEAAVSAEEMLEQLNASDDLVSGFEVGMAESALTDAQAEILAEFEASDAPEKSADSATPQGEREERQAAPDRTGEQKSKNAQAE
ncbi:MAG: hypothetical protein KDA33_02850 [Phycisphaerales bacterium]|nr:hypothetical protein [Phycisphaerales bacterium]